MLALQATLTLKDRKGGYAAAHHLQQNVLLYSKIYMDSSTTSKHPQLTLKLYSIRSHYRSLDTFKKAVCLQARKSYLQLHLIHGIESAVRNCTQCCGEVQGLLLAWNFNQPEAEKTFRLGLEADSGSAMMHWGIQQVVGPGANRYISHSFYLSTGCLPNLNIYLNIIIFSLWYEVSVHA